MGFCYNGAGSKTSILKGARHASLLLSYTLERKKILLFRNSKQVSSKKMLLNWGAARL